MTDNHSQAVEAMARASRYGLLSCIPGASEDWAETDESVREGWVVSATAALTALTTLHPGIAEVLSGEAGWQPIETAPKDGTRCDIWVRGDEYEGREVDAYYGRPEHECGEAGRLCDSCPPPGDMWCDWLGNAVDGVATHWMPLPAPPSPGDAKEGGE